MFNLQEIIDSLSKGKVYSDSESKEFISMNEKGEFLGFDKEKKIWFPFEITKKDFELNYFEVDNPEGI